MGSGVWRTQPGSHRTFLALCDTHGWLDTLAAAPAGTAPSAIFSQFESWLDRHIQDVEYFHWVRHFLPLTLVVRWLEEYAGAFLRLKEEKQAAFTMEWVNLFG